MLRIILLISVFVCGSAAAKPLITSSEDTAARACLAYADTPDRLIRLCQQALDGGNLTQSERAQLMNTLGDAHLDQGDHKKAEETYRSILEQAPLNVPALAGLGWALRSQDRDEEALQAFQTAFDIDPRDEVLAGLGQMTFETGGDPDIALQYLDGAIAVTPNYDWAIRSKGWIYRDIGRLEDAEQAFRRALDLNGLDENALYGLARVLNDLGQNDEALLMINEAVALDPDYAWYYAQRSAILRNLGRNAQAVVDADKTIELLPGDSEGYVQKSRALIGLARRGDALDALKGVKVHARDSYFYYWYSDVLARDLQYDKALLMIDNSIELAPEDHWGHIQKAFIALQLENYDLALVHGAEAARLDGTNAYGFFYTATALVYLDRLDEAYVQLDLAVAADLDEDRIGDFAQDLIAAGYLRDAILLRLKY
ncbi:tetratricopeptide repeat protein [Pseudaestuariivita rosea]|uniref:tetratricopeptide repeat protein n=1 Tax=Pseudaestuariivita rosea TaxID=2763263 RepID=UPI001ABBB71C|nr:tetratricopeptide repeat protein [Pseudaestuariivita rosea]